LECCASDVTEHIRELQVGRFAHIDDRSLNQGRLYLVGLGTADSFGEQRKFFFERELNQEQILLFWKAIACAEHTLVNRSREDISNEK
jgi:hypothetical protein